MRLLHMNFQKKKANPRPENLSSWMNPDVHQNKYNHFLDIDRVAYQGKAAWKTLRVYTYTAVE